MNTTKHVVLLTSNIFGRGFDSRRLHQLFFDADPRRKLNPLQKITYLLLLNILLPFQIVTGVLMWGADRWPGTFARIGGLWVLGPAHTLGSYLFLAFLIGHIYLSTTGPSPRVFCAP